MPSLLPRPRARGFSLLEVLLALALTMLMSGLVAASFSPWLGFQQDSDTVQRLGTVQALWLAWLEAHADAVEQQGQAAALPLGDNLIADGTVFAGPAWPPRLALALGSAGAALVEDGFHQPWTLRVSQGLVRDDQGVALHYHVLAVLSPGANGHFEAGTRFDPQTGLLSLAGDDRGVLIDGWPAARRQRAVLESRLERAAALWQDWFRARWEGDPERDPSIDYFAGPCPDDLLASAWDGASDALPANCAGSTDPAAAGRRLGLSAGELLDPTGLPLGFDALSEATRNPDQPDPGQRAPPYSARVSGKLPGGVLIARTVLGTL